MLKIAVYTLAGLAVGFAVASWTGSRQASLGAGGNEPAGLSQRLAEVERALSTERRQREALEESVMQMQAALSSFDQERSDVGPADPGDTASVADALADLQGRIEDEPVPPGRVNFRNRGMDEAALQDRFVEAGISPDLAQWIQQRSSELRMRALEARYEAQRDGVRPERVDIEGTLRAELGDADYERYLEAMGRSTSVGVGSVLASSPAAQAGLLSGDEVVSYGGQRVFDMNELNSLTFEGQPGETVAVDVIRDGQQIQLYLPRGPIGITGGGRFRGRP